MDFPAQCKDTQDVAELFFLFFFFDICPLESCYAYISYAKNDAFGRHEKNEGCRIFLRTRVLDRRDNDYIAHRNSAGTVTN